MYIRIEFEDVQSSKTKETQSLFFSSPNGMCLASMNAHWISSKEIKELAGSSIAFWHIDVDVLNKYYGGVIASLNDLLKYPGVSSVDVLPVEGHYNSYNDNEKYNELTTILMKYIDGVK